ncbi:helix-turn-helix domain containing protein [Bacillus sp. AFS002410]|uniref:helix-turn-helix domain containing protein n=1 Tax=Bacillus sp. AFS002410 TaxID=2033481 RepID=UPI000BEF7AEC|nr:helix-turn-helix domain containing protein [Bacillus sp. AFS002410]PEJ56169.1 helix-turn-helix domain containing protein [Bacillus sp. AFS002410]
MKTSKLMDPTRKRKEVVIVLEELDFTWDKSEIKEFVRLWKEGTSIWDLSKTFQRPQVEIALLIMDQEIKGRIKPRKIGLG